MYKGHEYLNIRTVIIFLTHLMTDFLKLDVEKSGYLIDSTVEKYISDHFREKPEKFSKDFGKYFTLFGFKYSSFCRKIFRFVFLNMFSC